MIPHIIELKCLVILYIHSHAYFLLQDHETAGTDAEETIPPESSSTSQSLKHSEPSTICQAPKRNKSFRILTSGSGVDKAIESLKEIVNKSENKPDDQYDAFAKHISAQLRELPLRSFIILQGQIQYLINRERLAHLPFQQQMHQQYDNRPSTVYSQCSDLLDQASEAAFIASDDEYENI